MFIYSPLLGRDLGSSDSYYVAYQIVAITYKTRDFAGTAFWLGQLL